MSETCAFEHRPLACHDCFWTRIKSIADIGMHSVEEAERIGREIKRLDSRTDEDSVRGRLRVLHVQQQDLNNIIIQCGIPLLWTLDDWYMTLDSTTCPFCDATMTRVSDAIVGAERAVVRKVHRLNNIANNM